MADQDELIASAVVVPDTVENEAPSSTGAVKRRQSSVSQGENGSKRPRLSLDAGAGAEPRENGYDTHSPLQQASPRNERGRRSVGGPGSKEEDRKRGKRLFGSILGTLSQSSSSSTTQRRRADIEQKQQAKLKLQAEEFDEKQRRQRDELLATRKEEQKKFDEQSMRIRHSNMLAMSRFLKTDAEPRIYYKPYALRVEDESRISEQVKETTARIDQELEESGIERAQEDEAEQDDGPNGEQLSNSHGPAPDEEESAGAANEVADREPDNPAPDEADIAEQAKAGAAEDSGDVENGKENAEDNEELVVAGEDTVIY